MTGFPATFGVASPMLDPGLVSYSRSSTFLLDPVTARERNVSPVPTDRLLPEAGLGDWLASQAKTLCSTLPKTVLKGLRGDTDITTADVALMAKIPYVVTGLTMIGAMALRGQKPAAAGRILAGVAMYYLAVMAANRLVNSLYYHKFGINLNLMFRTAEGGVDRVYRNIDSPRFDLLTPAQYRRMREKMGIPSNLASPDAACREQALRAVNAAESLKIVWSLLFALFGVSYVARSDEWAALLNKRRPPKYLLHKFTSAEGWKRVKEVVTRVFHDPAMSAPRPISRLSAWGLPLGLALGVYETMRVLTPRTYESAPVQFQPWQRTFEAAGTSPFQVLSSHRHAVY